ncbi:uncharacterized protein LOC119791270 isoform X2 [Cyprinodon tularosa]|uniref:uncharacterized protein LOC119791270 isoform X2 n=1 Tax=Cyprinodon tularosa TaxID=77115 RepID=UPI0018E1E449|nr:uncharacterized protein LOC119791270 isoform X2 [Cyprinodon tularosa]
METVKLCCVVLGLLWTFSSTSAHSEDIHDNQESCSGNAKWCSSSAHKVDHDYYEELWEENLDLAKQTLKLPFLQHMQLGDLQADDYTVFMIQDIYYLAKVTDMLEVMSNKDMPEDLKEFMKGRYESYDRFRTEMLKTFNLNGVNEIKVTEVMESYLAEYKRIMEKEEPIMFAVGLLPCNRLWAWIADQLNIGYGNAYWTWKKNNMGGHTEKHFKALLNKYLNGENFVKANEIFRKQMNNEHDFFENSLKQ